MLNPFPILLDFGLLAPFILRVVLGFIFVNLGFKKMNVEKSRWMASFDTFYLKPPQYWVVAWGLLEIVGGLLLIAGLYTQIAALVLSAITFAELFIEHQAPAILKRTFTFYLLLFAISLSLLFSGAGLFAFDIPL